jgi:tRNA (guanine-N7-)-methyltransferase
MPSDLLATTKRRRSRITPRQADALARSRACASAGEATPLVLLLEDPSRLSTPWSSILAPGTAIILDIGFGTGEPVEALALAEPEFGIIAVDVHTPGIGDLLHRIEAGGYRNIAVIEADVRAFLPHVPEQSLAGVRTFFPDPWPKARHHRRRLVTADFAEALAERVTSGGFWHLATDWPDYVDHILAVLDDCPSWSGGVIPRPHWRPITRYERTALAEGRTPVDLWFERRAL